MPQLRISERPRAIAHTIAAKMQQLRNLEGLRTIADMIAAPLLIMCIAADSIFWRVTDKSPPLWAFMLASLTIVFAIWAFVGVAWRMYSAASPRKLGNGGDALQTLMESFPGFSATIVTLNDDVRRGSVSFGSAECDRRVELILGKLKIAAQDYPELTRKRFVVTLTGSVLAVLILFSALYIADYSFELFLNRDDPQPKAGYHGMSALRPDAHMFHIAIEALYFSTVTATTVGYGEIHPTSCWTRGLAVVQALTFVFGFGLALSFAFSLLQLRQPLNIDDMINVVRVKLEYVHQETRTATLQSTLVEMPELDSPTAAVTGLLRTDAVLTKELAGFAARFDESNDAYREWLTGALGRVVAQEPITGGLFRTGCDWLTLHYRTRHAKEERPTREEWFQVGVPIAPYMAGAREALQVYQHEEPPYFWVWGESVAMPREPIRIAFAAESDELREDEWVTVSEAVVNLLLQHTQDRRRGAEAFTPEMVQQFVDADQINVSSIEKELGAILDVSLTTAQTLEFLQNACRVTLLALHQGLPYVRLPRFILLTPVVFGDNLIGGVAYVGSEAFDEVRTDLLSSFATAILVRARLLEEHQRDARLHEVEAIQIARNDFVMSMAHSIRDPLNSLSAGFAETVVALQSAADLLGGDCSDSSAQGRRDGSATLLQSSLLSLTSLQAFVKALHRAANKIMLSLSKQSVDALSEIKIGTENAKEFLELVAFVHRAAYARTGKTLTLSPVPSDWYMRIDGEVVFDVLSNLITNALRYARSQTVMAVTKTQSAFEITVTDDGTGVDPALAASLFKAGVFAEAGHTDRSEAHGFGLYFGRQRIELHGGKLYWDSSCNEGTRFVVEIPRDDTPHDEQEKPT